MSRCLVIGGGILGTAHAREALKLGYDVLQLERDELPRSSSARNFGLVWISGRASGNELAASLRTRELWEEIHREIPEMHFRSNGSLTLARNEAELRVMEECVRKEDAALRGWEILDQSDTRKRNPELRGKYLASLWCPLDATIEPDSALESIRQFLLRQVGYSWRTGQDVRSVEEIGTKAIVTTAENDQLEADLVIVCPGADHVSLFKEEFAHAPIRRVRLQMMNTEVFLGKLPTSIADGDSMRYYPAYDVPALRDLPAQHPVASTNHMQLLCVQREDGTLTIGDTHEYEEPFRFKLREDVYRYLHDVASELFGQILPPIQNRWEGIYSQRTDEALCDRNFIGERIITVTGAGGRGNTLAPVIAEMTFEALA